MGQPASPKYVSIILYFFFGILIMAVVRSQAVAISHYGPIANIIQMAVFHKVNENYTNWEDQRFRPGDVVSAGQSR